MTKPFIHNRHSFRLLQRHNTHYPALLFLLLLSGILIGGFTAYAAGDDYVVSESVPAPAVTQPAVITSPLTGTSTSRSSINVLGTCPAYSYVKLFRNMIFSGTSACSNGSWQIQTDVFAGDNLLQAHVYNLTDTEGPRSADVTINYQPPANAGPTPTSSSAKRHGPPAVFTVPPLLLNSNFTYHGSLSGHNASWTIVLSGGQAPYAMSVDWGDGSQPDLISRAGEGSIQIGHAYRLVREYQHNYPIIVTVTDAAGQTAHLQLFAVVTNTNQVGVTNTGTAESTPGTSATPNNSPLHNFMRLAAPTYAVTTLAVLSFWLGELRELHALRPH